MHSLKQALIFAAGLGTRLRPLTDRIPKALVEINGKPMLERLIEKLIAAGIQNIVINIHHFSKLIIDFVEKHNSFGVNIQFSDEADQLLDTGGGLKKAFSLFDPNLPLLLHNVDVVSNVDLNQLAEFHKESESIATLFVQKRISSRYLLFDENLKLCGWRNYKTGEKILVFNNDDKLIEMAFNGIHIVNPQLVKLITEEGKFSIIPVYLRLALSYKIFGFRDDDAFYLDVGNNENLAKAISLLKKYDV
ncbi:MAG: nucleotidyltransferase family protein [Bacteroidales bacterium]|jgi:NDP-sugar pyrophosphorylase family protein|nr:nucleotidyltransferase family protein [Bacteroidales bacterium]MDI9592911.1 nucleotidyltransferase family protein [Bacteroidota bacterium]OQC37982.1 MAG: D-glycero-alpha-D-manno-heptose 1-phosphate guanylyltransferase [Bacteroidetes bacterium ADurb.Bin041]HNV49928.1 nucleotidyltransferase family protein [Bacteroidales bacterium]HOF80406.1 nucleotidyltransferase family protein [Bacteroidales bacterium]